MGKRTWYGRMRSTPERGCSLPCTRQSTIVQRLQTRLLTRPVCGICLSAWTGLVNACREGGNQHPDKVCCSCRVNLHHCPFCRLSYDSDDDSGFLPSDDDSMPPLINGATYFSSDEEAMSELDDSGFLSSDDGELGNIFPPILSMDWYRINPDVSVQQFYSHHY